MADAEHELTSDRLSDSAFSALCRDCGWTGFDDAVRRCPRCASPRIVAHAELSALAIAHIDCDAFYASVEKRDDPSLADKPLIIGGGKRGVVSTACYVARLRGVKSAMPMFKALALCPDAIVLKPDMEKYVGVSRQIRALMETLTPLVEPLSLDEAFLDLAGTERLHKMRPAEALANLARRVENDIGVSVSIGLAPNKFLAKIASELDKPRGFAVVGAAEAEDFLAERPVGVIWGVGAALSETLRRDGVVTIGDLRRFDAASLTRRYGAVGARLARLAWGRDERSVVPNAEAKSISSEATFEEDIADPALLDGHLWRLVEKVSARMKAKSLVGRVVTLKLKSADFKIMTRRNTLHDPTDLADVIYRAAATMLTASSTGAASFRLIGVGLSKLEVVKTSEVNAVQQSDLLDPSAVKRADAERAVDALRSRFGPDAVRKGRSFR